MSQGQLRFEGDQPIVAPVVGKALPPLPSLDGIDRFGIDTETTTEPWLFDRTLVGVSYYLPDGRKGYVPMRHPGGGNYEEGNVREWLWREAQGKELVCCNAKHEIHTFNKFGVSFEDQGCELRDVLHAGALLDDRRGYKLNLDMLIQEELPGVTRLPADHAQLHQMPVAQAAPVAIEDAELAFRVDELQAPKICEQELETVLQLENDLVYSTCEMERQGSYLDVPLLLRWRQEVRAEYESRVLEIHKLTGLKVYPTKSSHMSKLFNHLGIENEFKTETGADSFEEAALLEFVDRHPAIQLALEARQLSSLSSKYLDKYLASARPDGRIYYSLHQLRSDDGGTIVGRYSSSAMYKTKEGGINVQQVSKTKKMPKLLQRWPIRKLFIPPPGELWVSADASQLQFRELAHYAERIGHPRLAKQYRANFESRLKDPTVPVLDFHNVVMEWTGLNRDFTKNVNYAKLFGGGVKKVALMCRKSEAKAKEIIRHYDQRFPECTLVMRSVENIARERGYVKTVLGRRMRFEVNSETERYYPALAKLLQGTEGDLIKLKILRLYRERRRLGITLRSTVHDEVNQTTPDPAAVGRVREFMNEQEHEMRVPIIWDTGAGPSWEEAK